MRPARYEQFRKEGRFSSWFVRTKDRNLGSLRTVPLCRRTYRLLESAKMRQRFTVNGPQQQTANIPGTYGPREPRYSRLCGYHHWLIAGDVASRQKPNRYPVCRRSLRGGRSHLLCVDEGKTHPRVRPCLPEGPLFVLMLVRVCLLKSSASVFSDTSRTPCCEFRSLGPEEGDS